MPPLASSRGDRLRALAAKNAPRSTRRADASLTWSVAIVVTMVMISVGTRAKSKNAVMSLLRKVHFIGRPRGITAGSLGCPWRIRLDSVRLRSGQGVEPVRDHRQVGGPGLGDQGYQVEDQAYGAVAQDGRAGEPADAAQPVVQRLDHGLDAAEEAIDGHAHALLGVSGQEKLASAVGGPLRGPEGPVERDDRDELPADDGGPPAIVETVSSGASDMHSSTWPIGTT